MTPAPSSLPTAPAMKNGLKSAPLTISAKLKFDTVALDFETAYSATYSVKKMGTWAYVHDPRFMATQVAAYCPKFSATTTPTRFDWSVVHGVTVIAHNAAFDKAVFDRLQEQGVIPSDVRPAWWLCTAALSRFLNGPSSLKDCAAAWLGIALDKSVRDRMAGHTGDLFDDVAAYALEDARICWLLWDKLNTAWPENERRLYEATRAMGAYGVHVDTAYIRDCCATLADMVDKDTQSLPWVGVTSWSTLSVDAFKAYCAKAGIEPPAKTAKSDADLEKWKAEHADTPPAAWIDAMQRIRSTNRTLRVFESMAARVMPHSKRMAYDILYCGASTGRWSGAGGLNMQNFNRNEIADGIDLRRAITASPGHRLLIIDYAQIESRVLLWLAGDHDTLDILRSGIDIYEAHARATMGYRDPRPLKDVNKQMRQLAKARVLGLGYGCGAEKFILVAKIMGGLDITFNDSRRIVNDYRQSNPLIISLWNRLETAMRRRNGNTYRLPLPSGRRLRYYNVQDNGDSITAESIKGVPEDFYGGKLTENFVSAVARDILADAWLRLDAAGYRVVMSVHDELVIEVDERDADDALSICCEIMQSPPPWAEGLPLAVEGSVAEVYGK